ncbi:hypothetical protein OFD71_34950, partial [Escherichia coli]|nr:hypothetical protein [Escherichia coli]
FRAILERDAGGAAHLLTQEELDRVAQHFDVPAGVRYDAANDSLAVDVAEAPVAFRRWLERNVHAHRFPGYRAVTLSLKRPSQAPGDVTA